jgi:hypothetical protein
MPPIRSVGGLLAWVPMAGECPRCLAIKRALPEKTPGWCSRCQRWQPLGRLAFKDFADSKYQHLSCLTCSVGAWCRDFWMRPNAWPCARDGHVEPFDAHVEPPIRPEP